MRNKATFSAEDYCQTTASLKGGETNSYSIPKMLTIRQVADTGIMPEHAVRLLVKENKISHIKIGNKVLINFTLLCQKLNSSAFE